MRAIAEDEGDEEIAEPEEFVKPDPPTRSKTVSKPLAETAASNSSDRESLRPVRSAKINANNNLVSICITISI